MTIAEPDRNVKIAYVGDDILLTFLRLDVEAPHAIALPVRDDLPDGVQVLRVWHEHARRAFGMLLWHPSFPVVQDGHVPPEVAYIRSYEIFSRKTTAEYEHEGTAQMGTLPD